jgi:hypothetical protein
LRPVSTSIISDSRSADFEWAAREQGTSGNRASTFFSGSRSSSVAFIPSQPTGEVHVKYFFFPSEVKRSIFALIFISLSRPST